jgi:hypothetical protein
MNSNRNNPDIFYFWLSLIDFLRESHPERLQDNRFILACTDAVTEAYEQAIISGDTPIEAIEQANAVLFHDLHFSRYDMFVNILWNEFPDEVPEDEAGEWAIDCCPNVKRSLSITPSRQISLTSLNTNCSTLN